MMEEQAPDKQTGKLKSANRGDKIEVGDITSAQGVAIGCYASVIIGVPIEDIEDLPPEAGVSPYQGLHYFDEQDADWFFGRERVTAGLVNRLHEVNFLAIVGDSGSGKSSLVRAGVIPAMKRNRPLVDSSIPPLGAWQVRVLTPTAWPLDRLANALFPHEYNRQVQVRRRLAGSTDTLSDVLEGQLTPEQPWLLVIDQFEEVFSQCESEHQREAFIANIVTVAQPICKVILTLRADFYPSCLRYDALRRILKENQEPLGPMSRDELQDVILLPAAKGEWKVQPGLAEEMLDAVGQEPGALPLLSHALQETWVRRRGRVLTLSGYREAGGVRGALAQTAEGVYEGLTPEEQTIARHIFLSLTEPGAGTQDTRRRIERTELGDDVLTEQVIGKLATARLITVSENNLEVAHEALIRGWPQLRKWLDNDREGLIIHRRLTHAAQFWQDNNRNETLLHHGLHLAQAETWAKDNSAKLNDQERAFLIASIAKRTREQAAEAERIQREEALRQEQANASRFRRLTWWLTGAAGLAVIAAALAIFSLIQANEARRSAEVNAELKSTSEAEAVAARATSDVNAALASTRQAEAMAAQATSDINARLAATAQAEASFAEDIAVEERDEAQLQAGLAFARELAATAIDKLTLDPDLCSLLALEAVALTYDAYGLVTTEAQSALHRCLQATQLQFTLPKQPDWINDVVFSPDGRKLATAGQDRQIKIWEASSGEVLFTLPLEHTGPVISVAFSPDGNFLITGSTDSRAVIWDIDSQAVWKVLQDIPGAGTHQNAVNDAVFSPDGLYVATGSADKTAIVWDVGTGESIRIFKGHTNFINAIAFSPDGRRLATASADGTARLWDVDSGASLHTLGPEARAVADIAFSPDGVYVITGSLDNTVRLWNADNGTMERVFSGHTGSVYGIAFNEDGSQIASASADGTIKLWDTRSGQLLTTLSGHTDLVNAIVFSPDGTRLASASDDATVKLWNTAQQFVFLGDQVAVTTDGSRLATSEGERIRIWSTASGQLINTIDIPVKEITQIVFSGISTNLLAGYSDGTVEIWETDSGQPLITIPAHLLAPVVGLASSPDGNIFATASYRVVRVWAANGQLIDEVDYLEDDSVESISAITFGPTGHYLAIAATDGTMQIRDVSSFPSQVIFSSLVSDQEVPIPIHALDFHPTRSHLVTANHDGTISIWDVTTGEQVQTWQAHIGPILSVAYSLDGSQLASSSFDRTIKVWSMPSAERLLNFTSYAGAVTKVLFTPDLERLIASNSEGRTLVFIRNIEELIALARERLTRALTPEECQEYLRQSHCP